MEQGHLEEHQELLFASRVIGIGVRIAVWAWTPLSLVRGVYKHIGSFRDLILNLFTRLNKDYAFQRARFIPADAAHQSQDLFD